MNRINIELDRIKDIALRGIRRTAVFLGLGVNAAREEGFKSYQLTDITFLRLVPDDVTDEVISHFKESFEEWVISNGLRELIETFAVYLDNIHKACLLMATSKGYMSSDEANSFGPAFGKKGVEEKLKTLRNRFGITTDKEKYFTSINQARNCITHRRGRVGQEDLRGDKAFRLMWWAFDIFTETPAGEQISLMPPLPEGGIYFKNGASIKVKVNEREKEYQVGDIINLSPNDVSEICFLVNLATDDIMKATINYSKSIGIDVHTDSSIT